MINIHPLIIPQFNWNIFNTIEKFLNRDMEYHHCPNQSIKIYRTLNNFIDKDNKQSYNTRLNDILYFTFVITCPKDYIIELTSSSLDIVISDDKDSIVVALVTGSIDDWITTAKYLQSKNILIKKVFSTKILECFESFGLGFTFGDYIKQEDYTIKFK